jgi:hypothetical protein
VCAQIHFNIGKEGVKLDDEHWHEFVSELVETNHGGKETRQVQADKTIPNSKPEIIIRDNEKETNMLIDFAILVNRNVIKKEAEKILNCKTLNNRITGHAENRNKSCTGNTGCPTRYRTRHFFINSNTIEDIATKFEQEYLLLFHIFYTMR